MYSKFNAFITELESGGAQMIDLKHEDTNVILGVLFFSVMRADGRIRPEETELYNHLIENVLQITEDERQSFEETVSERISLGEEMDKLVSMLSDLPMERKREMLNFMREISISDRELHESELNLVGEVARLLGVD